MRVDFLPIAYYEYIDAIDYYNLQQFGLGDRLKVEVDQAIKIIVKNPIAWQQETLSTRRYLLKNFPYKLVYHIYEDVLYVIAFAHTHRKPFYWIDRMK